MRELAITRKKSFVACFAAYKVYIQDDLNGDIEINGLRCRFLGKLKNGETAKFSVDDTEARLFLIADKLTKNYCNDSVLIPAGNEPVAFSGGARFAPLLGNPFRFDGVEDSFSADHRKKQSGKRWLFLVGILATSALVGFLIGNLITGNLFGAKEKTFTWNGTQITLDDSFQKAKADNSDLTLYSKDVQMQSLAEEFPGSLVAYVTTFRRVNDHAGYDLKWNGDAAYYDYAAKFHGKDYHYFFYILPYPSGGKYRVIRFTVPESDYGKYKSKVEEWFASVKFTEPVGESHV